MDSNKKFWFIFLAGVALAFCCVCGLTAALLTAGVSVANRQITPNGTPRANPRIGQLAPDFELTSLNGEDIHLSDLRGQPVVINFWASWCGPCTEEMPIFQDFSERYSGLQFYAINAGESTAQVQDFAEENAYTFNILLDPDETVNSDYRVTAIPVTFFLDAEGRIAAIQIGSLTERQFEKYLKEIGIPQE